MPSAPTSDLRLCAEVIVRIGLDLQPGQPLLIAEPYELQGVSRDAAPLVEAVTAAAMEAGGPPPNVVWGDPQQLRNYAATADWSGFTHLVSRQARQLQQHLAAGGAFLFPISSHPHLMQGLPADRIGELRNIAWQHFGPIVQRLTGGETQWSLVPAASSAWAEVAFADLPADTRMDALQAAIFDSLRLPAPETVTGPSESALPSLLQSWRTHLDQLTAWRDALNRRRHTTVRYTGPGTDLTVRLPSAHRWCTARLTTKSGRTFVANLPTEEIFTAPDRGSAEGRVRVSRPVNYGGTIMDGIELEFSRGCVTAAQARTGADILERLLTTDDGACRLGEVALVPPAADTAWRRSGRLYHHALLDENAAPHIALGEAYSFCSDSLFGFGLNRSLIHVDLPLDAEVAFD